jgi:hypothetical protein
MSQSIFKITDDFFSIMQRADENEGEINEELAEALSINNQNLSIKSENYVNFIKKTESDIDIIDVEIKRLTALKKQKQNRVDWLRGTLANAIDVICGGKFETPTFKLSVRHNKSVNVVDDRLLQSEFKTEKTTWTPNKTAIKEAIESGVDVDGAFIVESKSLTIK